MTLPTKVATSEIRERAEEFDLLTSQQVLVEMTGITYRTLDYWCRRGLIEPAVAADGSGSARLWSPSVVDVIDDLVSRIQACPYFPHAGSKGALT